jgi:hypothetical protein
MEPTTTTAVSVTIPGPWQLLMAGAVFAAGYKACTLMVDALQESIDNSIAELENHQPAPTGLRVLNANRAKAKPKTKPKTKPKAKPKATAKP